jgi:hypothetical protein
MPVTRRNCTNLSISSDSGAVVVVVEVVVMVAAAGVAGAAAVTAGEANGAVSNLSSTFSPL